MNTKAFDGWAFFTNNRFGLVFAALLGMFFVEAFGGLQGSAWQQAGKTLLLYGVLLGGLLGITGRQRMRRVLIVNYLVLLLGVTLYTLDGGLPLYAAAKSIASVSFMLLCSLVTERFLLTRRQVDREVLLAALCGYGILVMLFAAIFVLLDTLHGGAFRYADAAAVTNSAAAIATSSRALYLSLVTITTLGYGDITPVTQDARLFAALEAFVGQLYLAILVARLVGLQLLSGNERE